MLPVVWNVARGLKCCQWLEMLPVVSNVFSGLKCYQWFEMLPVVWNVASGLKCCQLFKMLPVVSNVASGFKCCQWFEMLPVVWNVASGLKGTSISNFYRKSTTYLEPNSGCSSSRCDNLRKQKPLHVEDKLLHGMSSHDEIQLHFAALIMDTKESVT